MKTLFSSHSSVPDSPTTFDVPDRGGYLGISQLGDEFIAVLALAPPAPEPVIITAPRRRLVPLAAIAACMCRRDARPTRIDVVSRTLTTWGDGPAAFAYRALLGPLTPASHRATALVVRVQPMQFPTAVLMRGGGKSGLLRTVLWCVERVRAAAASAGLPLVGLTAAELSSEAAWTLAPNTDRAAFIAPSGISGVAPPIAGDGQLIGANADGAPLALPIAGPSVAATTVIGDVDLAKQLVVRSVAIGVRVHIATGREHEWTAFINRLDDRQLVSCGPRLPPIAQLLVRDGAEVEQPADLSVLHVHAPGVPRPEHGYVIEQVVDGRLRLHSPDQEGEIALTAVTTPQERALIG